VGVDAKPLGTDWDNRDYRYPYMTTDGRENLDAGREVTRVLRGAVFYFGHRDVRCAFRSGNYPYLASRLLGFRVVVFPAS
jgi:formylglycine-generating enzyme required for sulfatase activity